MTERKTLPLQVEVNFLNLLCTYMLYDRAQETELRMAFEGLITERHSKYHDQNTEWRECRNQVCVNARLILSQAKAPEVMLNSFAIDLMKKYAVNFLPQGSTTNPTGIYAKLVDKPDEPLVRAPEEKRIVVP